MFAKMSQRSLALATMLSVAALSGCSKPEAKPTGSVKVAAGGQALVQADATTMKLTISDNGVAPSFTAIVQLMSKNTAGEWSGYVTGIPVGIRKFHVDALDGANVVVFTGETTATITTGSPANVYLMLQQVAAPNAYGNHAPVIDSLTSSASTVVPGGTVSLTVAATDPDTSTNAANKISGYLWAADCGTFDNAASQTPVWTAPSGADTTCNIRVTISDVCPAVGGQPAPTACSSSVTAALQIKVQAVQTGDATVNAYPNTCPVVMCVNGDQKFTYDAAGSITGYYAPVTVEAIDADGDDLKFTYSSVPCPGAQIDVTNPAVPGTGVNPSLETASNKVMFTANTVNSCPIKVDVKDYWHTIPAGSGLPAYRGCDNTGLLTFGMAAEFKRAPEIVRINQPNAGNQVNGGQAYTFGADVRDPNGAPLNNLNGYPLTIEWFNDGGSGTLGAATPATLASAGTVSVVWTAPAALVPGMKIRLKVTNALALSVEKVFAIVPANACALAANGTPCDDGNACTQTDTCQAGACVGSNPVACTASACHTSACNPGTGACVETPVNGGACNDGSVCTSADTCVNGACTGTPVAAPAAPNCQVTSATCDPVLGWTFSPAPAGTACNDGNACTTGETCQAGACTGGTPVAAPTAPACKVVSATCDPVAGWTLANALNGTTCSDGLACTQTDACQAGVCVGTNPVVCSVGQCTEPGGVCGAPPDPVASLLVEEGAALGSALGLAYDETGAIYQGGNMFQPGFDFGCGLVNSLGSSDAFAVKLAASTGRCLTSAGGWSFDYGDSGNDQSVNGLAVNRSTVAVFGQFQGNLLTASNTGAAIDYIAFGNRTTGLTTIKAFDLNEAVVPPAAYGKINAMTGGLVPGTIGADHFAVCGYTSNKVPSTLVTDPAAAVGGGADMVVAVLDNTGTLVWGRQFGGTGDQICNAVAFDDVGNVIITGSHAGVMNIPGLTPALAQPTGTNRWTFVAKLDGATGAVIAATNFGATGTSRSTPRAIVADKDGNIALAGQFQAGITFPTTPAATALVGTGTSLDTYIAKLNGTTLAPVWAQRFGGTGTDDARAIGVDTFGQVYMAGVFAGSATNTWGGAAVTATGTATDAFLLRLDPSTGVANYAAAYGDLFGQETTTMVVTRLAAGAEQNSVWIHGNYVSSITFPGLPALSSGNTTETRKFVVKMK